MDHGSKQRRILSKLTLIGEVFEDVEVWGLRVVKEGEGDDGRASFTLDEDEDEGVAAFLGLDSISLTLVFNLPS